MSLKTKLIASDQKTPRKTFIKEPLESMFSKFHYKYFSFVKKNKISKKFRAARFSPTKYL